MLPDRVHVSYDAVRCYDEIIIATSLCRIDVTSTSLRRCLPAGKEEHLKARNAAEKETSRLGLI